jgi:hypothetical protein
VASAVVPVAGVAEAQGPAAAVGHRAWELRVVAVVLAEVVVAAVAEAAVAVVVDEGNERKEYIMKSIMLNRKLSKLLALVNAVTCSFLLLPGVASSLNAQTATAGGAKQRTFATPQEAVDALVDAAEKFDEPALLEILGPNSWDIIHTSEPARDREVAKEFAAKAREKNHIALQSKNSTRAFLEIGNDDWPFPAPIVKQRGHWAFDGNAGRQEILYRRIGGNELDAIQICRGFVEAQHEYALEKHDGVTQYAQKIISTPGKQDGLAWQNADGTWGGPVGENVAKAIARGYTTKTEPYHGYYFKVLKGQGPNAPLGQLDFVVKGVMIGGFALIAAPAQYRITGVKTFMVSHDGVVYEKDLGPNTLELAKQIELFNPDRTWSPVEGEGVRAGPLQVKVKPGE